MTVQLSDKDPDMATPPPAGGTYSPKRYNHSLTDIRLSVIPKFIRQGKPTPIDCAFALPAIEQAKTGMGFPPEITDIHIEGVTAAVEGVSRYPELTFTATLRKTGNRILAKAICRDAFAMEIVFCNDQGRQQEDLARRVERAGGRTELRFTDVRYTTPRTGSDRPADPMEACARRLADNSARHSATDEEMAGGIRSRAAAYAAQDLGTEERGEVERLISRAEQITANRRPALRDRDGEPPRRKPVRVKTRRSTNDRWA